jgi:glycosyltransferase involved in cell wall biosynthesis
VLARADVATSVSLTDAARFRALYGRETELLPNGVDVVWLQGASDVSVQALRSRYDLTDETVLFMGSYAYRPNQEAIDFLVTDVFPVLLHRCPDVRLIVLGGTVPYERPWLIAPGVVPYEHLPAFIKAAAVSVAPIFSGSGTRLKIIESLAAGTPVVTTAKGMEGLPLEPGVDVLQAETADAFADALTDVLADPAKARRRFESGMTKVIEAFDWRRLAPSFNNKVVRLHEWGRGLRSA